MRKQVTRMRRRQRGKNTQRLSRRLVFLQRRYSIPQTAKSGEVRGPVDAALQEARTIITW